MYRGGLPVIQAVPARRLHPSLVSAGSFMSSLSFPKIPMPPRTPLLVPSRGGRGEEEVHWAQPSLPRRARVATQTQESRKVGRDTWIGDIWDLEPLSQITGTAPGWAGHPISPVPPRPPPSRGGGSGGDRVTHGSWGGVSGDRALGPDTSTSSMHQVQRHPRHRPARPRTQVPAAGQCGWQWAQCAHAVASQLTRRRAGAAAAAAPAGTPVHRHIPGPGRGVRTH